MVLEDGKYPPVVPEDTYPMALVNVSQQKGGHTFSRGVFQRVGRVAHIAYTFQTDLIGTRLYRECMQAVMQE